MREVVKESADAIMQKLSEATAEMANMKRDLRTFEARIEQTERDYKEMAELRNDVCALKEELENKSVATDVIISGIPQVPDEKVGEVFTKLCQAMQLNPLPFRSAFRVRNNKAKNSPLIVKLTSPHDRPLLFAAAAKFFKSKKRGIKLSDIGRESEGRIHLNESLTRRTRAIMQFATQLKRQKCLTSAFSFKGQVFVRVRPNEAAVKVLSIDEIKAATADSK